MIGKAVAAGGLTFAAAAAAPLGVEDIPARALTAYVAAAASAPCAIDWQTLAAVGAVESGHGGGSLDDDGVMTHEARSWAGAEGPMQFMPPTWAHYGEGGDVWDIDDAAAGAARLLCANSIEGDWANAVGAYNGGENWRSYAESRTYVMNVAAAKARYDGVDVRLLPAGLPRAEASAHSDTPPSQSDSAAPTTTSSTTTTTAPERDPGRLWDAIMRAWIRLGRLLERVGLGSIWRDADDAMFAPEPRIPTLRRVAPTSGLDPSFARKLDAFRAAAPGEITINSGHRTADEQWQLRVAHCPDPVRSDSTECTPWTAKVGSSPHESGLAADLAFADDATEAWAHANAHRFGLAFPLLESAGETWHVEPASSPS